jgi:hypothetical protein
MRHDHDWVYLLDEMRFCGTDGCDAVEVCEEGQWWPV